MTKETEETNGANDRCGKKIQAQGKSHKFSGFGEIS
jgi:hypothetical protein